MDEYSSQLVLKETSSGHVDIIFQMMQAGEEDLLQITPIIPGSTYLNKEEMRRVKNFLEVWLDD